MPILFKNCAVLDTERGELLPGHEVLVEGEIIREVSGRSIEAPEATVFDLGGRTLMPGLCDAHVHVTAIDADLTKLDRISPSYITARSINVLRGMLRRGFTTVRDAGGADHGLAQAVREGVCEGPRILYSGRALSQTGGHGDVRSPGEEAGHTCCPPLWALSRIGDGVAEVRRAARDELRKGACQVKIMVSGGVASPSDRVANTQFSLDEIRALAPRPQLILLDEPFSNLDVDLRERLSHEVRDILKSQGITAVLVTHDQNEAFAMADEIGVMADGLIQQWDTPYNLYHRPANRFVADFVGQGVFVPGTVLAGNRVQMELGILESGVPVECSAGCGVCGKGCGVDILLRPDDVVHDDKSPLQAAVEHKAFRGADILYTLRLESGARVLSLVPSHHNHALGEKIGIRLDVDHVVAFTQSPAG